jgi:hypothetical protein
MNDRLTQSVERTETANSAVPARSPPSAFGDRIACRDSYVTAVDIYDLKAVMRTIEERRAHEA